MNPSSSFIEIYHRQLAEPSTPLPPGYGRSLDDLARNLANVAAAQLRKIHTDEYPFEIALRTFYYLFVFQFANAAYLEPARGDDRFLPVFDSFASLFQASLNGDVHAILHSMWRAPDTASVTESLLDGLTQEQYPVVGPAGFKDPPPRASRPCLGMSLSWTEIEQIALRARSPGRLHFLEPRKCTRYPIDIAARRRLLQLCDDGLDPSILGSSERRILLSSIAFLPTYLVEGFSDHFREVSAQAEGLIGLVGGIEFQHHPSVALLIPLLKSRGRITAGSQHGAVYGQTDPTLWERIERFLFDRYVTWGYSFYPEDVPLPAIRLSRMRPGHGWQRLARRFRRPDAGSLLVVLPHIGENLAYSIHSPGLLAQRDALRRALAILEPACRLGYRTVVRIHPRNTPEDYHGMIPESLGARTTFVGAVRGTLARDAHRFDHVFFTGPNATGIPECIANGADFSVVADPADYQIRPEANEVFRRLIEARAWMTDRRTFEEFLRAPREYEAARREAIDGFARNYALRSRRYIRDWSRFLNSLFDEQTRRSDS